MPRNTNNQSDARRNGSGANQQGPVGNNASGTGASAPRDTSNLLTKSEIVGMYFEPSPSHGETYTVGYRSQNREKEIGDVIAAVGRLLR